MTQDSALDVEVLLLASRFDVTCDYVVGQVRRKSKRYLRLNSEDLSDSVIELDPVERRLSIEQHGITRVVTPTTLRSVFFRRPVFLRDYGESTREPAEDFSRQHWSALIRNLMLFEEARWINDPAATYRAEHKALQLSVAADLGFPVPETRVTNAPHASSLGTGTGRVALKGLDTVLLRSDGKEMFGYTSIESAASLNPEEWRSAPATIQEALEPKVDFRVTVIDDQVFPIKITNGGKGFSGDWRKAKNRATYERCKLPAEVANRCIQLLERLGLVFGAIDLALVGGEFYFLEVNPTGEWSWLVDATGAGIDAAIATTLLQRG